ncbi:MAG: S41 family peptidase [Spirochaetia bacterium]|nr:S41 family peptidase [Spirochaetia bacterium]
MKNKERFFWIILSAFLIVFSGVSFFGPNLLAYQSNSETREYLDKFEYLFQFLVENYVDEVPLEDLYEGALKGLFESLDDPYSYYLTADDMDDMNDTTTGKFGGVGLYISKPAPGNTLENPLDRFVQVVSPIEDTPAYRAGVHAGDYITKIEDESVVELSIDEVVDRLRGHPGTDVLVSILRGNDIEFEITLTRAIIEIPTVKEAMLPGNIGYLRIIQFTPFTAERVKEAIRYFDSNSYTSLIIDVRGNPGGLLGSVADIGDFFLSSGPIVSTKSRIRNENEVFRATRKILVPENLPIAVLIDKGSASAAEILAGALKDTGRGTLIGETSFGKGSVQKVMGFHDGGLKLTIARYYTPGDINIDKIGIDPDREVKEKELSDEETESLGRILKENLVAEFIENFPDVNQNAQKNFIRGLQKDGIILEDRIIEKLIRNEYNRNLDIPPVYDLDFDIILQEAVRMINTGEVKG